MAAAPAFRGRFFFRSYSDCSAGEFARRSVVLRFMDFAAMEDKAMEHYAEFMLNELIGMGGLDLQETAKVVAQIEELMEEEERQAKEGAVSGNGKQGGM